MLVLEPMFHKTIWGGNRLDSVYGKKAEGLGHLYSVRAKKGERSNIILNGKYAGRTLYEVAGEYPLSIALVDAASDLSIQVHPGDVAENKHESYYFIQAPSASYIYCGLCGIPAEGLRAACESGSVLPHIGQLPVKAGDYAYIGPGLVHALTAGSFVYEIEQGADKTYRLFDYNRKGDDGKPRCLHLEQALAVLNTATSPKRQVYQVGTEIGERTYATKLLGGLTAFENEGTEAVCITLLSGEAVLDGVTLKTGMSVVVEPKERLSGFYMEKCMAAKNLDRGKK